MTEVDPVLSVLLQRIQQDHLGWINGDASGIFAA